MPFRSTSLIRCAELALIGVAALSAAAPQAQPLTRPLGDAVTPAMKGPDGYMTSGTFRKAEAPVSGSFSIKNSGGQKVLVLSNDFKTNDMAPDLKVIFSPSNTPLASTKAPGFPLTPGSYTILASLKSSSGAQTYKIPASIDLKSQGSVLIWCKKFNATMAWAPLKP